MASQALLPGFFSGQAPFDGPFSGSQAVPSGHSRLCRALPRSSSHSTVSWLCACGSYQLQVDAVLLCRAGGLCVPCTLYSRRPSLAPCSTQGRHSAFRGESRVRYFVLLPVPAGRCILSDTSSVAISARARDNACEKAHWCAPTMSTSVTVHIARTCALVYVVCVGCPVGLAARAVTTCGMTSHKGRKANHGQPAERHCNQRKTKSSQADQQANQNGSSSAWRRGWVMPEETTGEQAKS